jgi:DNA-binding PadR family transcriptional regulator
VTTQDLTHAFGPPALSSLRGLLPPREEAARPEPVHEVSVPEPRVPEPRVPEPIAAEPEPSVEPDREERPTTARRRRPARVAPGDQVDLLVLLSLRAGPTDGRGVVARVREASDGALDAPEQTVHVTLHRLTRHHLLGRRPDPRSGRSFYALTEAGERATRARLREWQALTRGVDAVARRGGAV